MQRKILQIVFCLVFLKPCWAAAASACTYVITALISLGGAGAVYDSLATPASYSQEEPSVKWPADAYIISTRDLLESGQPVPVCARYLTPIDPGPFGDEALLEAVITRLSKPDFVVQVQSAVFARKDHRLCYFLVRVPAKKKQDLRI